MVFSTLKCENKPNDAFGSIVLTDLESNEENIV
jgi:hypothetical protein